MHRGLWQRRGAFNSAADTVVVFRLAAAALPTSLAAHRYRKISDTVKADMEKEQALAAKGASLKRKMNIMWLVLGVMLLFLCVSVAATSVAMFVIVEATKETKTSSNGTLTSADGVSAVKTAAEDLTDLTIESIPHLPVQDGPQTQPPLECH